MTTMRQEVASRMVRVVPICEHGDYEDRKAFIEIMVGGIWMRASGNIREPMAEYRAGLIRQCIEEAIQRTQFGEPRP